MLRRLMMATSGTSVTPVPNFANVKWLLNMDGSAGSTVFPDSTGLRTWTGHGGVAVDTSQGYNAALFEGVDDYIDTPHASDLVLGTQDFCIEGFAHLGDAAPQQTLIEKRGTGFAAGDWVLFVNSNAAMLYSYDIDPSGTPIFIANGAFPNGVTTHWAWTRAGNTMRLFINGVLKETVVTSAAIASSSAPLAIGRDNVGGGRFWLNGLVRACRGTIGEPVYTSDFTPPTAPLPTA